MTESGIRLDPVTRWVRELPGEYYLPREAARMLDISVERLKTLGRRKPDTLGPGYVTWMGEVKIYLYKQEDIDQIRAYFTRLESQLPAGLDPYRAGRGKVSAWSGDEHADRHRRRALARYHRLAAIRYTEQGDPERADAAAARAAQIKHGLDEQRRRRTEQLTP